jgi:ABC-2 type transport system ATP-binding protein
MTTTETAVRVRGLHKHYGAKRAVDGLDLTVHRGEIVAVLGPNGAGKTTTVEILEGFRGRDGGEVSVLGVDPATGGRAWRARLGIVLQSANDQAELTVHELVHHYARYYPGARDADEVIASVGLTDKARTRTRQLSGGQRRRLDVALGIVGSPELLFLDEPTTGFDPEARRSFWDLIGGLRDAGTTVLLTTHYLDEAEHLADRVTVVRDGRVVAEGTPADLGGRGARQARVRWTETGPGGVVVHREAATDTPTAYVAALAGRLAHRSAGGPAGGPGSEIPGLQVLRPSLEDVYLGLIGDRPEVGADVPAPVPVGAAPPPHPQPPRPTTDDVLEDVR